MLKPNTPQVVPHIEISDIPNLHRLRASPLLPGRTFTATRQLFWNRTYILVLVLIQINDWCRVKATFKERLKQMRCEGRYVLDGAKVKA